MEENNENQKDPLIIEEKYNKNEIKKENEKDLLLDVNKNEQNNINKDTKQEKTEVEQLNLLIKNDKKEKDEEENKLPEEEEIGEMCPPEKRYNYDPYLESNYFNRFFFYWAFSILRLSKRYILKTSDLGRPAKKNDSTYYSSHLHRVWDDLGYKNCQNLALFKTVLRTNACALLSVMCLSGCLAGLDYFSVIITKQFIDYFNDSDSKEDSIFAFDFPLWVLGLMFLGTQIIIAFLNLHTQMIQNNFGVRAGYELNCFIYNKILNYSPSSFTQRASHGEIVNFIQIDSNRLSYLVVIAPNAFVAPLMIIAYIYLLFDFFGFTFIFGLTVLIIFFGLNYCIGKVFRRRQKRMMGKKDLCMKATTETLDNIKILKLYNWENEFKKKILDAKRIEMDYTTERFNMTILNTTLNWLCPTLVSIITIGVYQQFHETFNISTMLIGLSIFSKLQGPIAMLPDVINSILETTVSMKRIEDFLKQPDVIKELVHQGKYDPNGEYAIKITKGCFSWGVKQIEKKSRWDATKKEKKPKDFEPSEKTENSDKNITEEKIPQEKILDRYTNISENNENNKINEKKETIENINNAKEVGGELIRDDCKIQVEIPKGIEYDVTLKNIDFEVKPGELVGIVGEVGCGKSSLLQAILNSLILLNPKECDGIHINGKIGYAAQIPWIQNDTIRNNILFAKEFDEEKYNNILKLCELNEDLETFEGKDLTEIGEKGVNLSGGQKVRVSLARTIYNEPDIYLFDDPISALDANVGKKIMKNCIVKYLQGKTRIVVTHALSYLKYMDRIIYMKSGRIEWVGSYNEVQNQPFYAVLAKENKDKKDNSNDASMEIETNKKIIKKKEDEKIIKITKEEEQSRRGIKWRIYIDYFRYMGGVCYITTVIVIMGFWQANKGGGDLWLAYWSKEKNQEKTVENPSYKWVFFIIFSGFGLLSVFFMFLRVFMLTRGVIHCVRTVHRDMIESLIKAPINLFHETIPRGQIYNRLSRDLEHLNYAMYQFGEFLISLMSVIGSFILCGIYDQYSLFYMPIVFILGYIVTRFYLSGVRPLTRFSFITRSPLLNIISETLPGNLTIRAFGEEQFYKGKYFGKINTALNINLICKGVNVWFQEMFKLMSIFYLAYLVLKTIFDEKNVTAQSCSIVFTYSVLLQGYLGDIYNRCANLENDMISMERCIKYMHIVQEAPSHIPETDDNLIQENWPQNGEIQFKDFSVKYRPDTEIVLKKINFTINPGEKVGICGRTGSGKSTICLCLFRILEPLEGTIYIDNIDTTKIGLDLLRKNITIIPQDPCLLEGTLKYNIDPFNKNSDEEVIQILKDIGFEYYEPDDKIMSKMIEQNGANLSVGQKQLVCIARALLRKTKIVVMDEATASIDMNTEQVIQKAMNLVLENSTVITVAHRIKTIINYDKILVLDNGEIKEFDTPTNLLKNEKSFFYELFNKSTL